jgi:hypothetical protein
MKSNTNRLLSGLLGAEIIGFSRIHWEDPTLGESFVAQDALVLHLADARCFELLTGQSRTVIAEVTDAQMLFLGDPDHPETEKDPDERLSLCELTGEEFDRPPQLPVRVEHVTEVWVGEGDKAYLVAITVEGPPGSPRLDLCTETDEIEIMTPAQLRDRLQEIERCHNDVTRQHYGVDSCAPVSAS